MSYNRNGPPTSGSYQGQQPQAPPPVPPRPPVSYYNQYNYSMNSGSPNLNGGASTTFGAGQNQPRMGRSMTQHQRPPYPVDTVHSISTTVPQPPPRPQQHQQQQHHHHHHQQHQQPVEQSSQATYFGQQYSPSATSPGQQATYNPQWYANQASSPMSRFSAQSQAQSTRSYTVPGVQQSYSPATYQTSSIANAVNEMYGPVTGSYTPSPPLLSNQTFASPPTSPPPLHSYSLSHSSYAPNQSPTITQRVGSESHPVRTSTQHYSHQQQPQQQQYPSPSAPPQRPLTESSFPQIPSRTTSYQYLEPRHRHTSVPNPSPGLLHSSYHSTPSPDLSHADSFDSEQDYPEFPPGYFQASTPTYASSPTSAVRPNSAVPSHASRTSDHYERLDSFSSRPLPPPPVDTEPDIQPTFTGIPAHDDSVEDAIDESIDEITRSIGEYRYDTDRISGSSRQSSSYDGRSPSRMSAQVDNMPQPLFSGKSGEIEEEEQPHQYHHRSSSSYSQPNGYPFQTPAGDRSEGNSGSYSDDEAEAGLRAMREAEEQDAADQFRRVSSTDGLRINSLVPPDNNMPSSAISDLGIDLSLVGGGDFVHPMPYGPDHRDIRTDFRSASALATQHPSTSSKSSFPMEGRLPDRTPSGTSYTLSSGHSSAANRDSHASIGKADSDLLSRKLSFEEGVERNYIGVGYRDRSQHEYLSSRPLPPPPTSIDVATRINTNVPPVSDQVTPWSSAAFNSSQYGTPYTATMSSSASVNAPPRSQSLQSHTNTTSTIHPIRAKTDAEERKRQALRSSSYVTPISDTAGLNLAIDLPTIPHGRRFQPSKLSERDFIHCREPWAMSGIEEWLRRMTAGESELRHHVIVDALIALFLYKVPNMNIADAEVLTDHVVSEFHVSGVLVQDEEWLRLGSGNVNGVLYQLTGLGCYATKLHEYHSSGRCYSRFCQRTVKKITLGEGPRQSDDWATFYGLSRDDYAKVDKKEVERQNILHEIVHTEEQYMDHLKLLRILYRDNLEKAEPPVIPAARLDAFVQGVFSKLEDVERSNADFLLPYLKYRQKEQGPWIKGFSDIFRDWIRKAKGPYIEYAANVPNADFLMRQEESRNSSFQAFLDEARNNPLSKKLPWSSYLGEPITRLQRYGLLLVTVQKNMTSADILEAASLHAAIDEIKAVTLECDSRVADTKVKVNLSDLQNKLILRPEYRKVELNLDHLGRELYYEGELQRLGGNRFTWVDNHVVLLDNFLVLAKAVPQRDALEAAKNLRYDVSKWPIPMHLLVLESTNDDPVVKSSVKGMVASTKAQQGPTSPEVRTTRASSNAANASNSLVHVNTSTSLNSMDSASITKIGSATTMDTSRDDRIYYPFRVKHLGHETYTLFATTAENRKNWTDKIVEAKTKHAASLFSQHAEPFKLNVLADSAFVYDAWSGDKKSITIPGTPLDRAIEDVESRYTQTTRPAPVCRTRVNCATTFMPPYGDQMVAVGTDYGVYTSELNNPRGWRRAITALKVTQIAILEEFNLFLIISDKSLIAHHLDVVCPPAGEPAGNDSVRKAPQKLSGTRDVGFFSVGRMKDRTLVFYKKRDGLSATFKILEPILQKATEKKSRLLRRGKTEFFRDYDDFYIPTECTSMDLFSSSLAVATSKGFEVLNLDKKQPWTVPDLRASHITQIAARLQNLDSLAMLRLNDNEFLCVYTECAVYVNKHGDINRSAVLEFLSKNKKMAALYNGFLILFDNDFVEILDANNGRLKQIIAGKDVRCLDSGRCSQHITSPGVLTSSSRTIKFSLQHPEHERVQIVVELNLNEACRDN